MEHKKDCYSKSHAAPVDKHLKSRPTFLFSFAFLSFFVTLASPNLLCLGKKKNEFFCFALDFS